MRQRDTGQDAVQVTAQGTILSPQKTIKVPTKWAEAHKVAACPVQGQMGGWPPGPPAELALPRYPVTQLNRQRPLDLRYVNKTVPASTLQILWFSERRGDRLKKFCLSLGN